jgi:hypothetical protein
MRALLQPRVGDRVAVTHDRHRNEAAMRALLQSRVGDRVAVALFVIATRPRCRHYFNERPSVSV